MGSYDTEYPRYAQYGLIIRKYIWISLPALNDDGKITMQLTDRI